MSDTKDRLIDYATQTVQSLGIHALTIRDLGERAGIKSSSVMYHFKNKNGLIEELTSVYHDAFFEELNRIQKIHTDPFVRLDKLVKIFQTVLEEDKLCLCGMLASESATINDATKERTKQFFIQLEIWVKLNLEKAEVDVKLAKVIISSLEGAILLDKLGNRREHLNAVQYWIKSLKSH